MNEDIKSSNEKLKHEDVIPIKFAYRPVKTYKLVKIPISDFKKYSFITQIGNQVPNGKDSFLQITIKCKDEEIVINNENEWNEFIKDNIDETNVNKKLFQNIPKLEFEYISAVRNYLITSSPEDVFNKLINAISNNFVIQNELKTFFENEMNNTSHINNNEINSKSKNAFSSTNNHQKNSFGELIVNKLINISTKINDINQLIDETNVIDEDESDFFNNEELSVQQNSFDLIGNSVVSIIPPQQEIQMSVFEESKIISSNINEKLFNEDCINNIPNSLNNNDTKTSTFSKLYNKKKKLIHDQMIKTQMK